MLQGNGTNAENICKYFEESKRVSVVLLFSNNKKAGVLKKVRSFDLDQVVFSKKDLNCSSLIEEHLSKHSVDLIVLRVFYLKFLKELVEIYEKKL